MVQKIVSDSEENFYAVMQPITYLICELNVVVFCIFASCISMLHGNATKTDWLFRRNHTDLHLSDVLYVYEWYMY